MNVDCDHHNEHSVDWLAHVGGRCESNGSSLEIDVEQKKSPACGALH
jgi:hypothetical protein